MSASARAHPKGHTPNSRSTDDRNALISHVAEMNDNARLERLDRQSIRQRADQPTTVREKCHDCATDKSLRLAEVQIDEDLPLVFHELAARKKGMSKRLILQQAFDVTRNALNLNQLLASPSHIIDMESWVLANQTSPFSPTKFIHERDLLRRAPTARHRHTQRH